MVGAGVRLGPRRTEMGASNSVHDLLADDPAFEPVVPRSEAGADGPDVEAGVPDAEAGAPGSGVLELKVGLEIIHVAFPGPRSLFCACQHGSVCLVELPATSAPGHDAATFFEAARAAGRPTIRTPIGNLVSSLGAISGSSVDLLSMVRALPSLRRLGEQVPAVSHLARAPSARPGAARWPREPEAGGRRARAARARCTRACSRVPHGAAHRHRQAEMTAWLWDYCRGTGAMAHDASRCAYGGKAIYLCSLTGEPSLLSIAEVRKGVCPCAHAHAYAHVALPWTHAPCTHRRCAAGPSAYLQSCTCGACASQSERAKARD